MTSLAHEAEQFRKAIARRNRQETGAGVLVVVLFAIPLATLPTSGWVAGSVLLIMLVTLMDLYVLRRWGRVDGLDDVSADDVKDVFARELARQGRLLRWAPVWYVLPLIVAALSFMESIARLQGEHAPMGIALPVVGFGIAVAALNVRTARKLEQRRAALVG